MDKLQYVQNAEARLVRGTRKYYEIDLSRLTHENALADYCLLYTSDAADE